ncbi:MAG: DUF2339 domain-containing protein [Byssovorax sp.]
MGDVVDDEERPAIDAGGDVEEAEEPSRDEVAAPAPVPGLRPDWERWIGVRGAAALGACVLVIAGLYFFKYSLEQGLISPAMRVVLGVLAGLVGLGASEHMARKRYTVVADWLAGAGISILYTAVWASHSVYELVSMPVSFVGMILVTVLCGGLALHRKAMVIAVLGLLGGFATPVALASGSDHPIGLFGYLLLLDVALLYLAHKRGWPLLAALSLGGTVLYQAGWVSERMQPETLPIGIGVVLLFAGVFSFTLQRLPDKEGRSIAIARAASFVLPFVFGVYFGLRSDLGEHLAPLGGMVVLLSAGALFIARRGGASWITVAAAAGSTAVLGAWLYGHSAGPIAWETTGIVALLALVFHAALEMESARPSGDLRSAARAAAIAAFGALVLFAEALLSPAGEAPLPFLAGALVAAVIALRQSTFAGRGMLRLGVAIALDGVFLLTHYVHRADAGFPAPIVEWLSLLVVSALGLHACFTIRRDALREAEAPEGAPTEPALVTSDGVIVLLPSVVGLYFGFHGAAGAHLWPLGLMAVILTAASSRFALGPARQHLGLITALVSVASLGIWTGCHDPEPAMWEIIGLFSLLAALLHASLEAVLRREGEDELGAASVQAVASSLGSLFVLLAVAVSSPNPFPWLLGAAFAAALTIRHAMMRGRGPLHLAAAIPVSLGMLLVHEGHVGLRGALSADGQLALAAGVAALFTALTWIPQPAANRRWASRAALIGALFLGFDVLVDPSGATPRLSLLTSAAVGALALVSAARLSSGLGLAAATLVTALVQTVWAHDIVPAKPIGAYPHALAETALLGLSLTAALFTFAPWMMGDALRKSRAAHITSALAACAFAAGLYQPWTAVMGHDSLGVLALAIAALPAISGVIALRVVDKGGPDFEHALAWLFGVPLALVTIAIPLQLHDEQITIAWAIEGALLIAALRPSGRPALATMGLGLLTVVSFRLILGIAALDEHARSATPVLNWLLPTYGIPAAALLFAHRRLSPRAGAPLSFAPIARIAAAAGLVLIFTWLNLAILDAFGTGPRLDLFAEHVPARDLTLSLAWAVYALALLGVGMGKNNAPLRWGSLILIIVTLGKVFLYDLGHLHDLYRVASLVGLALSLITISLSYQRFVFARPARAA